jgi:hypothetical protein
MAPSFTAKMALFETAINSPCPVHGAHTPKSRSFAVHLDRKVYRCFRCGSAGNHLDLYAAVTRQRVYHAALDLCAKLQQPVPWLAPHS